nr:integrase, catalytic region, zinc finger, CCHC-type, peptidase aspartic, catalytic [Tanacetum cinerariifolium]
MSVSLSKNLKELKEEFIEEVQEMLNIFESMEQKVDEKSLKENFLQNEIDRLLEVSLISEIQDCALLFVEKLKNKLLKDEILKSSSDSKDIQANLLKRIKILENDYKRSQAQSIDFELKLQHQKEKMACDVSCKLKLSTLNDENVLRKTQVESIVQERENIKLEFQKLFNSIKATRTQHQKEVNELSEHVNQKTYAYADVRTQNQDLLMTISELKDKLRTNEKWKYVNTKFDKFETLGKLVRVTPFNKNLGNKAKNVSITKSLEGDDLLTGSCDSNLYTIFIFEMAASSPVCLMSRATSTKSWLWHRRLSQLNFGTINQFTSKDLVDGLSKFKYNKDHLCSACERDMDNFFGPMYEEYYVTSSQKVLDNSATHTLDNEHTSSSSLIVVEEDEALQIVYSSAEQVTTEPNSQS